MWRAFETIQPLLAISDTLWVSDFHQIYGGQFTPHLISAAEEGEKSMTPELTPPYPSPSPKTTARTLPTPQATTQNTERHNTNTQKTNPLQGPNQATHIHTQIRKHRNIQIVTHLLVQESLSRLIFYQDRRFSSPKAVFIAVKGGSGTHLRPLFVHQDFHANATLLCAAFLWVPSTDGTSSMVN